MGEGREKLKGAGEVEMGGRVGMKGRDGKWREGSEKEGRFMGWEVDRWEGEGKGRVEGKRKGRRSLAANKNLRLHPWLHGCR